MTSYIVPQVLRQKCVDVKDSFSNIADQSIANGKILMHRGEETKYFWSTDDCGKLFLYRYCNGTEHSHIHLTYNFGQTASVSDVIYYPRSTSLSGVVVAVSDHAREKYPNYIAYFCLQTCTLVKCFSVARPITALCNVMDGTRHAEEFLSFNKVFQSTSPYLLLIGCRHAGVYIMNLDFDDEGGVEDRTTPVRAKRAIPLSKCLQDDQMFVFRADEGVLKCIEKDKVFVSSLTYIEKCKVIAIGFNFGGIMFVSIATSKIYCKFFIDGVVKFLTVQEPEEDPRPILYYWTCIKSPTKGTVLILSSINFPKDEGKDPSEYTFLEPAFIPLMKWCPDHCTEMIAMRTIQLPKRKVTTHSFFDHSQTISSSDTSLLNKSFSSNSYDTSLMFMFWVETTKIGSKFHGALFDLNSFYAKRLTPNVVPDNTIARQFPFFSRFFSPEYFPLEHKSLDVVTASVFRFPAPAFLKDSIDQLFYPSTFYITINYLSTAGFGQLKVEALQAQLVSSIADNVESYFECPTDPAKWIYAIGLANSLPTENNLNEERACILRILVHIYLPAVLRLIASFAGKVENLKLIQRWIWKEIELTKTKFDDLCSPLFANPPMELSPDARGYIHHARAFFHRACLILEALMVHVEALNDEEWKRSISLQYQATRQVEMFSLGIAFGLMYGLLPMTGKSLDIHNRCVEELKKKISNAELRGIHLEIMKLMEDIVNASRAEPVWRKKSAHEWFPPAEFSDFLPVLLLMNVDETSKLILIGYYCIEYEKMAINIGNRNKECRLQQKLFDRCCALFMQDDFSIATRNRIMKMWIDDRMSTDLEGSMLKMAQISLFGQDQQKCSSRMDEEKLKRLPLGTKQEVEYAKEQYLKLEYGVFKFNWNVMEKRRFDLLIQMDAVDSSENEPSYVRKCRERYAEVCSKFPWLFEKNRKFPKDIVQNFRKHLAEFDVPESDGYPTMFGTVGQQQQQRLLQQPQIHLAIQGVNAGPSSLNEKSAGKRKRGMQNVDFDTSGNELEEMPLTIATPAKRQRLMLFSTNTPVLASAAKNSRDNLRSYTDKRDFCPKDWEKVTRIVQTPLSLQKHLDSRIPIRRRTVNASRTLFPSNSKQQSVDVDQQSVHPLTPDHSNRHAEDGDDHAVEDGFSSPLAPPKNVPATPASILRSNKKISKLPNSVKFSVEQNTHQIPSRVDNLIEQVRDNSFTAFDISETESASASMLFEDDNDRPMPSPEKEVIDEEEEKAVDAPPAESLVEIDVENEENKSHGTSEKVVDDKRNSDRNASGGRRASSRLRHNSDRGSRTPDRRSATPDRNSVTPDRESVTLDRKSVTPDRKSAKHDRKRVTPDRNSTTPDRNSTTPERKSSASNRRSRTPDRRSCTPDADRRTPDPTIAESNSSEEGNDGSNKWVSAHLRRSTRMRSPRKFFDEVKENLN